MNSSQCFRTSLVEGVTATGSCFFGSGGGSGGTVFAIVSSWEGHPKALIEAMACGMPCIGVESPGIQNVIKHRSTGLLVKATVPSIKEAIKELLNDSEFRSNLSRETYKYITDKFSFDACFSKEYAIVQKMLT